MRQLSTYINEKLVLNKDTFKKPVHKYFPQTTKELKDIVKKLIAERLNDTVIDLNDIDTSKITDMSEVFYKNIDIVNIDISTWDVSNVKDMKCMFMGCINFVSGGLDKWETRSLENISRMFEKCHSFTGEEIKNWDVSKLRMAYATFRYCWDFTADLEDWNLNVLPGKSVYIDKIFAGCKKLKKYPIWYNL